MKKTRQKQQVILHRLNASLMVFDNDLLTAKVPILGLNVPKSPNVLHIRVFVTTFHGLKRFWKEFVVV